MKKKCAHKGCRKMADTRNSPLCPQHHSQQWKENHPLHYSFNKLKFRAKERGKDFSLTRKQYIEFAKKTDYARLKGKSSLSLSIDRKNNDCGYHWWNIQALTIRENSRKQFVPFFAHQMENAAYEPTPEELAEVERKMREESV